MQNLQRLVLSAALTILGTAALASETITYTYDVHGRLQQVSRSGSVNNGISSRYYYDPSDNRASYWSGTGSPPSAPAATPPAFSINDAAVSEGGALSFTMTRSGTISSTHTVNYATSSGTATSGTDFTATSGTLSFGPDDFTRTVSVQTTHDTTYEPDETLYVTLSSPSGSATLSRAQGTGTIINDDPSNLPPTPVADYGSSARCLENGKLFNVTANDTDPDGNYPITLIGIDSVTGGASAVVENSTSLRFYPAAGNSSVVTYRVQDSLGAQATGTLTVTVSGPECQ